MKINSVFSLLFVALLGSCDYNELTDTENPASSSMDDLLREYSAVIDYDEAKRQKIVPGQKNVETSKTSYRRILMNWGWDGSGDNIEYEPSATTWYVSPYTFQYNTTIYYNLRKK